MSKAVIDGELQFTSPSAIQKFDPHSTGGCPRKWWYRYVAGVKDDEGQRDKFAFGSQVGKELEVYLKGGARPTVPLAVRSLVHLPTPGPDLIVEEEIEGLTADGLRVIVKPDVMHARGVNVGGSDITATQDPLGTVEIIDHKTLARSQYLPLPDELIDSLQMLAYGEAVRRGTEATHIRLSHNSMVRSPAAVHKVTRLHVVDEFPRRWEYVDGVVRQMRDVARITDVAQTPINRRACSEYGGCQHAKDGTCAGPKFNALIGALGETRTMSLLNTLRKKAATPTPEELEAQAAAERASRVDPTIKAAYEKLLAFGSGMPTLTGRAAMVVCALTSSPLIEEIKGNGEFGEQLEAIEDPSVLVQLAKELPDAPAQDAAIETAKTAPVEVQAVPVPHPAAVRPPDAPASNPEAAHAALAAKKPGRPKKVDASAPAPVATIPVVPDGLSRALFEIGKGFLAAAAALGATDDLS